MESELIPESTQASDDGALLHLGEQTTTPIAQAILGTAVVELIAISATVSNDGVCNDFVIHYEGTTDGLSGHSLYLLVLGWKAIHRHPLNHLRYYSRRSL